jgi:8-oxo-dGTP diphosphatase
LRIVIDVVCGVLMDPHGRVLACRRPTGKALAGLWEFPGGKVDPGESPEQALVRELREELAIRVEVGAAMSAVIWHYPWAVVRLLPFRCRLTHGVPQAIEHEELRWCDSAACGQLDWVPADLPVLAELGFRSSLD